MMLKKIEQQLETTLFRSRWLLAPFYMGLVLSLFLLFVKFVQEFWHMFTHVLDAKESEVIVGILMLPNMAPFSLIIVMTSELCLEKVTLFR